MVATAAAPRRGQEPSRPSNRRRRRRACHVVVHLNETSECDTIGVTIGLQSNFCDALLEGWTSVLRIARPPTLDALDAWIAREPEPRPSRPEAVRRLLAVALEN